MDTCNHCVFVYMYFMATCKARQTLLTQCCMLQKISQMNMKRKTNPKGDAGCLSWMRKSQYWCRGAWPLPDIFSLLLLKADALTCVSVTRRFDLRASGPTALRWQDSDVGLEQRRQLIFELGKHGHKKVNSQCDLSIVLNHPTEKIILLISCFTQKYIRLQK